MKTKKILMFLCCALALGIFATSCEEDDYTSQPPTFSDMTFTMVEDGSTDLRAGERVLATCVQSKKGHLLNLTKYNWSADTEKVTHSYKKELKAGYDNESQNPTDTLVFENPGTYKVTFSARYTTSGDYNVVSRVDKIDQGKITYKTPSFQFYDVIIEKRVTVK